MKKPFIKKADIIIIVVLLVIAAVLLVPKYLSKDDKLTAQIIRGGEVIETIDLSQVEKEYTIDLDNAKILVEKNRISFVDADCPDKLCVKCGKLTHAGDTAVCVPTATVITLSGNGGQQVDAISY
jgi:hypothetical protein